MTADDYKRYIGMVLNVYDAIDFQEELRRRLIAEKKPLYSKVSENLSENEKIELPGRPELKKSNPLEDGMRLLVFIILTALIGAGLYWCLGRIDSFGDSLLSILVPILALVLGFMTLVLGVITIIMAVKFLFLLIKTPFANAHAKKEYKKEVAEYNRLATEKAEKENQIVINKSLMNQNIEENNKIIVARNNYLDGIINRVNVSLSKTNLLLSQMLACDIVHKKYRSRECMIRLYEYLDSGRTKSLGIIPGDEGAYNILEREIRLEQIIYNTGLTNKYLENLNNVMNDIRKCLKSISKDTSNIAEGVSDYVASLDDFEDRISDLERDFSGFTSKVKS